ncbi:hypothetical protein ACFW2V_12190 [Streptomyces sp. NPDC058947]|uniref:hypothetical protein n=1 Tax=Streptomyces sp. NPDC058947 TaxID=3346675 RepID=UPI003696FB30
MNAGDLDRHITGNWGEDSVAPEFITARELGDLGAEQKVVIDAAPQTEEEHIPVTVEKVSITSGMVYVTTKELAWPLVIPEDETVWFADED